jgi:hypothetical protein
MTNHTGRLYALAATLAAFFVLWAVIAAKPWQPAGSADPRMAALDQRARVLRREAALVRQIALRRAAAVSNAARRTRQAASAAPAPVRIVSLPPLVITRTS